MANRSKALFNTEQFIIHQYLLPFKHERQYLHCIKMSPKFALYCNVANVVLISIWTSDNLFRQEYLICMQGGQRHVLWLPPFTSSANAVSQHWREYFFAKDNVQILKQMEDLLNSQLDILMYFIIISLLDGNMLFKSDKETACVYQGGLTPQPACRPPDFLSHSFPEAHQYTRIVKENVFFFFRQTQLGEILPKQSWENVWPVPQLFHTSKALWRKLPLIGTWLRQYFIFSSFSSLSVPSNLPPLLLKQLTLARKRVSGFRGALHLHKIKPNQM